MDQEILDLLLNFDGELANYRKNDVNGRFTKFMAKRNMKDHRILPTNDGSIVIGPRGDFIPSNSYLVKYPNNGYYIGPLSGQYRQGSGFRSYADRELVYVGDYANNMKAGKGKLWSVKDKRFVYDGNWANDVKNGYGEMWKNGVIYKGNWLNDKLDGIGRMDWPSGQTYEGSFAKDLRNGEGTMTFPNGDQYVGSWRAGRPHGKGSYLWRSGEVYQGTWVDGVMEGSGEIDYGIPVRGSGSVRDGSVQMLNYQLQKPDEWQNNITKSSQFIKSYRETIVPESVRRSLKADVSSTVGAAGFGGKAPPANLNFSYAPEANAKLSTNTGSYNVSTTGYNANTGASNFGYNANTGSSNVGYNANAGTSTFGYNANTGSSNIGYNTNTGSSNVGYNSSAKGVTYNTGASNYGNVKEINVTSGVNTGYGANIGSSNLGYNANLGGVGANSNAATYSQTNTGTTKLGLGYDVKQTAYAVGPSTVEKLEGKEITVKTAPTGSYNNNPLNYVDPDAAARAHIDSKAAGGTYNVAANNVNSEYATIATTTTNTYTAGTKAFNNKVEEFNDKAFKSSAVSYDVKGDTYGSNFGGYKTSTAGYEVSGPSKVAFGQSNTGNLRIGTSDINSENVAFNANRGDGRGETYTVQTRQVRYN